MEEALNVAMKYRVPFSCERKKDNNKREIIMHNLKSGIYGKSYVYIKIKWKEFYRFQLYY